MLPRGPVLEGTISPGVAEFAFPGGLVLTTPEIDGLFCLNSSAAFVWNQTRGGTERELLISRYMAEFGVSPEIAEGDVSASIADWTARGLLRRVGHAKAFHYKLCETSFRVLLDSDELEAEITPRLGNLATDPAQANVIIQVTTEPDCVRLVHGKREIGREATVSAARAILLQEMVRLSGNCREWLALLHAGAAASDTACVVLPGASGSGKSTLAAALMQSGLAFHADDSVGIEKDTLLIPPMPFALAIREGSWPVVSGLDALPAIRRYGVRVRFLPPAKPSRPVPAAALVFPHYQPDSPASITRLDPFNALLHLKDSGFWVDQKRESTQTFLAWVQSLPAFRIVYSDVNDAVTFVRSRLPTS